MDHKLLVVSDIHITEENTDIIGLDPLKRFNEVLAKAAHDHPDADRLMILGDLTHHGRAEQYIRFRQAIKDLPWPVSLTIGNHDDRATFIEAFPNAPVSMRGWIDHVVDFPDWRLITLDSNDQPDCIPDHSGYLAEEQLQWLKHALQTAGTRKCVIFIHHPPLRTFFDGMDEIGLRNSDELLDMLGEHDNAVQIIGGHVHRTISGVANGMPVTVFKSPCHQMPLTLGAGSCHLSIDEPGAFGVVLLHSKGITIHSEDVFTSS